jgi:hypothetical protein
VRPADGIEARQSASRYGASNTFLA